MNDDISTVVSTMGHLSHLTTVTITATAMEKINLQMVRGCPVNKNIPTKMSKGTFIRMCLKFQQYAGLLNKVEEKTKYARINGGTFISTNIHICKKCKIGEAVRNNKKFEPPTKLEFTNFKTTKEKLSKKKSNKKLTKKQVLKIRELYANGHSVAAIQRMFPIVKRTTVSDVVHRITWKNV